jgi:hypothetical protein
MLTGARRRAGGRGHQRNDGEEGGKLQDLEGQDKCEGV